VDVWLWLNEFVGGIGVRVDQGEAGWVRHLQLGVYGRAGGRHHSEPGMLLDVSVGADDVVMCHASQPNGPCLTQSAVCTAVCGANGAIGPCLAQHLTPLLLGL
jgi:hypothetical protein